MPKLYQLSPRVEINSEDLAPWLVNCLCDFRTNYPNCEIYEIEEQWPGFYLHCYPGPYFDQVTRFVIKGDPDSEWEEALKHEQRLTYTMQPDGSISVARRIPHEEMDLKVGPEGGFPYSEEMHPLDPFRTPGVGKDIVSVGRRIPEEVPEGYYLPAPGYHAEPLPETTVADLPDDAIECAKPRRALITYQKSLEEI